MLQELKKKILKREAKVGVIGLGYVGLPLAISFAKQGFCVFGIDTDRDRIENAKRKKSYISDITSRELAIVITNKRLIPTSDIEKIAQLDIIVICVPTPLKRKYTPDVSYILKALKSIAKYQRKGTLVILESTTYPGTTEELMKPILESKGLICGRDFYLAFSPERVDPGNKRFPVTKIPKLVGGITKEATELTKLFYQQALKKVIAVSSPKVAETAKLLENTFRFINIALVNELCMMAHKLNIDIWEVIKAASTKPFGFMPFYPGPGVGGHCIPEDPLYLYWKARRHGFAPKFIKMASLVNSYMPKYIVHRLMEKLTDLKEKKILVIGVTYKKDIKDLRRSPGIDLIAELQRQNCKVSFSDPLVPYLRLNGINLKGIDIDTGTLCDFDCIVVVTDHSKVDYKKILKEARLIFDARNVYAKIKDKKIIKL